jgi:hypothetical protein
LLNNFFKKKLFLDLLINFLRNTISYIYSLFIHFPFMTYTYKTLLNLSLTMVLVGGCLSKNSSNGKNDPKDKPLTQLERNRQEAEAGLKELKAEIKNFPQGPKVMHALDTEEGKKLVKELESNMAKILTAFFEKNSDTQFNAQQKQEVNDNILKFLKLQSNLMKYKLICEVLSSSKPFDEEQELGEIRMSFPGLAESEYKHMLVIYEKVFNFIRKAALGEGQE